MPYPSEQPLARLMKMNTWQCAASACQPHEGAATAPAPPHPAHVLDVHPRAHVQQRGVRHPPVEVADVDRLLECEGGRRREEGDVVGFGGARPRRGAADRRGRGGGVGCVCAGRGRGGRPQSARTHHCGVRRALAGHERVVGVGVHRAAEGCREQRLCLGRVRMRRRPRRRRVRGRLVRQRSSAVQLSLLVLRRGGRAGARVVGGRTPAQVAVQVKVLVVRHRAREVSRAPPDISQRVTHGGRAIRDERSAPPEVSGEAVPIDRHPRAHARPPPEGCPPRFHRPAYARSPADAVAARLDSGGQQTLETYAAVPAATPGAAMLRPTLASP